MRPFVWTRARARRSAGILLAVLLLATAAACRPRPEFYEVPDELPAQPGDVIRKLSVLFDKEIEVKGVAVMYRSTDVHGQPNAVSGTVLMPRTPWEGGGARPIVGFAPGTQGLGDKCAPSYTLPSGDNYELASIQALLDRGYAVAVTDYEQLGPAGDHTYLIKDSEAHALLDVVRAARQLPNSYQVGPDSPIGLWGYSQGGQAVAAAAELADDYAPELDIRGVVAGAPPVELVELAQNLDGDGPGNDFAAFLGFAGVGLNAAYPELDLESYLNEDGRFMFDNYRDVCVFEGLQLGAGLHIDDLTTSNPMEQPDWQARLEEQRLGSAAPSVPALIYAGDADQVVLHQPRDLYEAWCAAGAEVLYANLPGADHIGGVFSGHPEAVSFLSARFAGEQLPATCA